MLIKEYRIPLPLTVEEYKIAQLYMIAKKSREETKDAECGVEILINEPYTGGPGGSGQYTRKVYHVGRHLPGWFKALLPKSALGVEEEAWNAYPYTKTRYTCPFVEKFFLEIETVYRSDPGTHENVFNLTGSDLRNRVVELIDIVNDEGIDIPNEENPLLFVSVKTGRGPLSQDWLQQYNEPVRSPTYRHVMCAYKLCKVEFRYWGMQTKLERFIHDVALRKTMLRAHRQAWVWQDEWYGLNMDDIRRIERETQEALRKKLSPVQETTDVMGDNAGASIVVTGGREDSFGSSGTVGGSGGPSPTLKQLTVTLGSIEKPEMEYDTMSDTSTTVGYAVCSKRNELKVIGHEVPCKSRSPSLSPAQSRRDQQSNNSDESDSEFYECEEEFKDSQKSLVRWSSMDLITEEHASELVRGLDITRDDRADADSQTSRSSGVVSPAVHCTTTTLIMVLHAGSILDGNGDIPSKKADIMTFSACFDDLIRRHYSSLENTIAIKLVPCPSINGAALSALAKLSPYSFNISRAFSENPYMIHDCLPIGAIPILSTVSSEYEEAVYSVINAANSVYKSFVDSKEGRGFRGMVCLVGDSLGSVLAYDVLCHRNAGSPEVNVTSESLGASTRNVTATGDRCFEVPSVDPLSSNGRTKKASAKLNFDVHELYMFGSPLSLVLAYRNAACRDTDEKEEKKFNVANSKIQKPNVSQVYNLFHPADPMASRLEPFVSSWFSALPPINVPRYRSKSTLDDKVVFYLEDVVRNNVDLFTENDMSVGTTVGATVTYSMGRRLSEASILSNSSGLHSAAPIRIMEQLSKIWWGDKRLDYAIYCPEGLTNFPTNVLPHLFHASYWESADVVSFILRQLCSPDSLTPECYKGDMTTFVSLQPREKWTRKRTSVKLKNLKNIAQNHRANDVIVKEGKKQSLTARFMYGSYDVITLTGEKVDIYMRNDFSNGDWVYLSTQFTDKTGRVFYTLPEDKIAGCGVHCVKMIVRGDHSSVDFRLAVVPPRAECVVFSIDGSFTASVSVTGRNPKVQAGAVDVVRHWQELGYLIIYISARPDMQQQLVISWLMQHNFPYGLVVFADRFSTDPLNYKTVYLKNLIQEHEVEICAAYGSGKDISVYTEIGLKPSQIFIIGKVSKKHQSEATVLHEGYASHLSNLISCRGPRPAQGNTRMLLLPRGCFGYNSSLKRRRSAKRSSSFPLRSTGLQADAAVSPVVTDDARR